MIPWSISTTIRNPYRLRDLLSICRQLEGRLWDTNSQVDYQILLIQNRLYGFKSHQFYEDQPTPLIDRFDDEKIPLRYEEARELFLRKNYEDPPIRGRQSLNPLKKFGFVVAEKNRSIKITPLGQQLLGETFDLQDIFLRCLWKWQIPNPDNHRHFRKYNYNIKPFIGTMHLINRVNELEEESGRTPTGLSREEFCLFVPTLTHYENINRQANRIVDLRNRLSAQSKHASVDCFESYEHSFLSEFLETNSQPKLDRLKKNLRDYGDNTIRYFRLTSFFHLRGAGYHIDLEPRRAVEIQTTLTNTNGQITPFEGRNDFTTYISDPTEPKFPWATPEKLREIVYTLVNSIGELQVELGENKQLSVGYSVPTNEDLSSYIEQLRARRLKLLDALRYKKSQSISEINDCIHKLKNIYSFKHSPLMLEEAAAIALNAFNDAIKIQPNYPVGDDNQPSFTAPPNVPDIECYYDSFNLICEVTMTKGRDQWYREGQPVMRHLRDFECRHPFKPNYCLFVAPSIHRDTVNTFFMSVKHGYEGTPQNIIPLTIAEFCELLRVLRTLRKNNINFHHTELQNFFDKTVQFARSINNSREWLCEVKAIIQIWVRKASNT